MELGARTGTTLMTAKHEIPTVWVTPERTRVGHRQLRAQRHQHIRRLLRQRRTLKERCEHAVFSFCMVTIFAVSVAAAIFAAFLVLRSVNDFLKHAFGG